MLNTNRPIVTKNCPYCLGEYSLGIDGTVDGCDRCMGIVRDRNGMIVPTYPNEFMTLVEDERQEGEQA